MIVMLKRIVKRGEIYNASLGQQKGSVQSGSRPVVIVSNHQNNKFSPTINVLPVTSKGKNNIPVHVNIGITEGLQKPSVVLTEQIITIDKKQLENYIGNCNNNKMYEINKAMMLQLEIDTNDRRVNAM